MKKYTLLLFLLAPCFGQTDSLSHASKPRLMVLTDIGGDPDDQQSMVRLLLYSNAFRLEGLIATSRLGHGMDTQPELIEKLIKAYGLVFENLQHHDSGYPHPDTLYGLVKCGLGDPAKMGAGWDTQASRWIVRVAERAEAGPLWISVWGGCRELAQALWSVRERRNKKEMSAFIKNIRVYAIADQDRWGYWINKNFPELIYIYAGSCGDRSCQSFRGQYLTGDGSMQNAAWIEANVRQQHGPLAALYPRNGAGVNGMKEGDTPSFMFAYQNGLTFPEHPEWGGWGGRFQPSEQNLYIDAMDELDGGLNERHTVSRWRLYFQRELVARLDWCRSSDRDSANHPPLAIVNGSADGRALQITCQPGEKITLDAGASRDPDGHQLKFHWWRYEEASTYQGPFTLQPADASSCQVLLPSEALDLPLHLILEVTDTGLPPLTAFRRIILVQK